MFFPLDSRKQRDRSFRVLSATFLLLLLLLAVWVIARAFFSLSLSTLWLVIAMAVVSAGAVIVLYPPAMWLDAARQGVRKI